MWHIKQLPAKLLLKVVWPFEFGQRLCVSDDIASYIPSWLWLYSKEGAMAIEAI